MRIYDATSSKGLVASSVRRYGNLQINDFLRPSTFNDPMLGKGGDIARKIVTDPSQRGLFKAFSTKAITTTSYAAENASALSPTATVAQYGDDMAMIMKVLPSG